MSANSKDPRRARGGDGEGGGRAPRVVITGFMGAGKSTVARALARALAVEALDLDDLVEAREGRTPQELIEGEGEASFREAETRALADVLGRHGGGPRVVALGGGAWTLARNRALVARHGWLAVWLDVPFGLCWRRIAGSAATRPLARDRESARRLYDERLAAYGLADLRVRASGGRSAAHIAAEILERARAAPPGQ